MGSRLPVCRLSRGYCLAIDLPSETVVVVGGALPLRLYVFEHMKLVRAEWSRVLLNWIQDWAESADPRAARAARFALLEFAKMESEAA